MCTIPSLVSLYNFSGKLLVTSCSSSTLAKISNSNFKIKLLNTVITPDKFSLDRDIVVHGGVERSPYVCVCVCMELCTFIGHVNVS